MNRLLILLILMVSASSFANVIDSNVIDEKGHKKEFTATLDNPEVLNGKCIVTKEFSPTSYEISGSQYDKSVRIEVEMEDRRIETGTVESQLLVRKTVPADSENNFCDRGFNGDLCSGVAAITFPIWAIPAMTGVLIRDVSRSHKNSKFLKQALKKMNIPMCEE